MSDETLRLLAGVSQGDRECIDRLMTHVYDELKGIASKRMRDENAGHTLQPTALVNEAFLRMIGQSRVEWKDKAHFFAIAANQMRRILIDHARKRTAGKRGGKAKKQILDEGGLALPEADPLELLALDDVLSRLSQLNERHARVVELRYFAGLDLNETAEALGVSVATVKNDWRVARAWLATQWDAES
ncbi:MAG: sigma-70 family RNA polymerase sigma factor [Pirellula sp.]|jgi:RNA polymerase sigma factor (TIGR02999 family)|nr:sigma-70 family RNA polymerase sigma factor [Pirellula sp.]